MNTFRVWDPHNGTDEEGRDIEAHSPLEAAEDFAELDTDGQNDGAYIGGDDLDVRDADGRVWRYIVAWVDHPASWQDRACEGAKLRAVKFDGERESAGGAL